jgi:hypothetical protein
MSSEGESTMQNKINELRNQVRTRCKLLPIFIMLCVFCIGATDRKSLSVVDVDQLTLDCQVNTGGADEHALVWWMPNVFWEVSMAQNDDMSPREKQELLNQMKGVTILCILQGQLTDYGNLVPASKAIIQRGMTILFTNKDGEVKQVQPVKSFNTDVRRFLLDIKAMMSNLLGTVGESMQFFVLDNRDTATSAKMDPYKGGLLSVRLTGNGGAKIQANFQFPFHSLYVPRICPNGKEAHVSWNFCPWTGKQLKLRLLQE